MRGFTIFISVAGVLASIASIVGFLSVKPLPLVDTDYANFSLSACDYSKGDYQPLVEKIHTYRGQAVFVDIFINAAAVESNVAASEQGRESDCILYLFGDDIGSSGMIDGIDFRKYFEFPVPNKNHPDDEVQTNLVLPNSDAEFVLVDNCEANCYSITGPVVVKEFYNVDGRIGIGLIPVDIHKNAYLTARYECRLEVNQHKWSFFGWLNCLI